MRVVLVCLLGVSACGDDGGAVADAGVDADLCPGARSMLINLEAYGELGPNFPGQICIGTSGGECADVVTNRVRMCVPNGEFSIRTEAAGYERALYMFGPNEPPPPILVSGNDNFVKTSYWDPLAIGYPPTTMGHVVVAVGHMDNGALVGLPNATATVTPTGTASAYLGADGLPDMSAGITSSFGQYISGDVPPGMVDVDVNTADAMNCRNALGGGWASPTAGQIIRVPVVAGLTTIAQVFCEP